MNSIKNLIVIVMLLGVSYGAFQVINAPDSSTSEDTEYLDIQIGQLSQEDSLGELSPDILSQPETEMDDREFAQSPMTSNAPPILEPKQTFPSGPDKLDPTDPVALQASPATPSSSTFAPEPTPGSENVAKSAANLASEQFQPNPQTEMQPVTPKTQYEQQAGTAGFSRDTGKSPDSFGGAQPEIPLPPDHAAMSSSSSELADAGFPSTSAARSIDWQAVNQFVAHDDLKSALRKLSSYYNIPMSAEQRRQMLNWLDALAGKVIYSTEHYLQTRPYVVGADDTIASVASKWRVPPELIININRSKIDASGRLTPGTELKSIQGPFNAQLSMDRKELTLFLDGMYAGRFSADLDQNAMMTPGSFAITDKAPGQLGLANGVKILDANSAGGQSGGIRLSPRDVEDVSGILTASSQVKIMR